MGIVDDLKNFMKGKQKPISKATATDFDKVIDRIEKMFEVDQINVFDEVDKAYNRALELDDISVYNKLLKNPHFPNKYNFLVNILQRMPSYKIYEVIRELDYSQIQPSSPSTVYNDFSNPPQTLYISDDVFALLVGIKLIDINKEVYKNITVTTRDFQTDMGMGQKDVVIQLPVNPLLHCDSSTKTEILLNAGFSPDKKYPYLKTDIIPDLQDLQKYTIEKSYNDLIRAPEEIGQLLENQSDGM